MIHGKLGSKKSILKLEWYLWGKVENSIVENGDAVPTFVKYRHGGHGLKTCVVKGSWSK